jgi:hypothetical protein
MTEHDQQHQRINPVEIVEAVKRGSIYLGYWVFVLGLAYTASPAGVAHWAFWAVGLTGVLVAGGWALRGGGVTEPAEPTPPPGPPTFGERRQVDIAHYRPGAVSAGGGPRYQPPDPPQLMK